MIQHIFPVSDKLGRGRTGQVGIVTKNRWAKTILVHAVVCIHVTIGQVTRNIYILETIINLENFFYRIALKTFSRRGRDLCSSWPGGAAIPASQACFWSRHATGRLQQIGFSWGNSQSCVLLISPNISIAFSLFWHMI